jgi:hypothetical protein
MLSLTLASTRSQSAPVTICHSSAPTVEASMRKLAQLMTTYYLLHVSARRPLSVCADATAEVYKTMLPLWLAITLVSGVTVWAVSTCYHAMLLHVARTSERLAWLSVLIEQCTLACELRDRRTPLQTCTCKRLKQHYRQQQRCTLRCCTTLMRQENISLQFVTSNGVCSVHHA